MKVRNNIHVLWILVFFGIVTRGQDPPVFVQMSNRLEYRLPDDDKKDELFTNTLDLSAILNDFEAGLRLNHYQPADGVNALDTLSQRYFQYRNDWLKMRVGNFYKRIGKGLSFHAFEKQDIALDRVKQSFIVDNNVDGILVDLTFDKFEMSALSGRPGWLAATLVKGGEFYVNPWYWLSLGSNYIKITESSSDIINTELSSAILELSYDIVSFYGEYVNKSVAEDFTHKKGHATYLSSNVLLGNLGISTEYKKYVHFKNSYSTPPTLVREHFISLLNRQIHQVYADDEAGYQIEVFYSPTWTTSLVLNYSQAESDYGYSVFDYNEIYAEFRQDIGSRFSLKLIFDQMKDGVAYIDPSRTGAIELDYFINDKHSLLFDIQYQQVRQAVLNLESIHINRLFLLSYSLSRRLSLGVQYENSSEPSLEKSEWTALNLSLTVGQRHELYLFYGERRAGKACSGGVCLPLPAFEGFELRLVSRL